MMDARPVRVVVVDDHEVVRIGLCALLARNPQLEVVGQAGSVAEAVTVAAAVVPDVVVLDVRLPDGSGVEACREIRAARPETRVIMLTSYADDEAVVSSIISGASGYLLKQTKAQALIEAIINVAAGGSLLDPGVTQSVLARIRGNAGTGDPMATLTAQERRILDLVTAGKTNREIAADMYLADKTVRNYVSQILQKLGASRRAEAAALAARSRLDRPRL